MKLRKRDLFLLVAAPALMLGAIGTVAGLQVASKADEVRVLMNGDLGNGKEGSVLIDIGTH